MSALPLACHSNFSLASVAQWSRFIHTPLRSWLVAVLQLKFILNSFLSINPRFVTTTCQFLSTVWATFTGQACILPSSCCTVMTDCFSFSFILPLPLGCEQRKDGGLGLSFLASGYPTPSTEHRNNQPNTGLGKRKKRLHRAEYVQQVISMSESSHCVSYTYSNKTF